MRKIKNMKFTEIAPFFSSRQKKQNGIIFFSEGTHTGFTIWK